MRLVHAVCDENGRAHGGLPGDQSKKEIRESAGYAPAGGWKRLIACTDAALAGRAAAIARAIAAGDYGYSQDAGKAGRWSGFDAIEKNGIGAGCGNFDCSSLVLSCYRLAGLDIPEKKGSTRDLEKILTATGLFTGADGTLPGALEGAAPGTVFCTPGVHAAICVSGAGTVSPGAQPESGEASGGAGMRIRVRGSVRIRESPVSGKTLAVAHGGDVLNVLDRDEATGWYRTEKGYITDKGRYVERIRS